jgi:hypothetical protein
MKALIEISGKAEGCWVVPTCGRSYTNMDGGKYSINLDLANRVGCDTFLCLSYASGLYVPYFAFGMSTCVQVFLPYPWSKHELISNVPIETCCRYGYLESYWHVIKYYFKKVIV